MSQALNSIFRKILDTSDVIKKLRELKGDGKHIVFTNGCFDLIHPGHTRYLAGARKLGDCLVVALNSDDSVRAVKGPHRPIFPQAERAEILAALEPVDYVTFFDEPTPRDLIAQILPAVLVKGADWGPAEIVGREEVEAAGGKIVCMPVVEGYSTTAIVEAVLQASRLPKKS